MSNDCVGYIDVTRKRADIYFSISYWIIKYLHTTSISYHTVIGNQIVEKLKRVSTSTLRLISEIEI